MFQVSALARRRDAKSFRKGIEMRAAFAHVDPHGGQGEPAPADRALIDQLIRRHRKGKARS